MQFHDCTISYKRSWKDTDRRIDDVEGEIEGIDGGYAKRLWQKSGNGSDGNVVDRNVAGDDIGKSRPMKDRIDDLPFSQDWPDRATSSTLQRGFNPGEPRNNHLPAIHPFASRSLLLLRIVRSLARNKRLSFSLSWFSLVPIFPVTSPSRSPFVPHVRHRLNNTLVLLLRSPTNFYSDENQRNTTFRYFSFKTAVNITQR